MKRLFLLFCLTSFGILFVQAQSVKLPNECKKILDKRFQSWKMAEIEPSIIEYFQRERSFEQPNLIKGDWNGDGKTDYAVLLENKNKAEDKIIVVLMRSKGNYKNYILDAADCLMSVKKGKKDFDLVAKKSFRYKNDAIFSYFWEKAGSSYVFEKGKFRAIGTSD